jgi:hypothetical protein
VNGLTLPCPYLIYLRGRVVSHVQTVQSDKDTLHHVDKPFIDLIPLGLVRLHLEAFGLGVAILTTDGMRANPIEDITIFAEKHDEALKF